MPHFLRRDLLLTICAAPFVLGGRAASAALSPRPAGGKFATAEEKLVAENLTRSYATTHAEMMDLDDVLKAISQLQPPRAANDGILVALQARLKADDDWLAAIAKSGLTAKT
jgi:hypothetical protein